MSINRFGLQNHGIGANTGGRTIKSIQTFAITIPSATSSFNQTIESVDTSIAIVENVRSRPTNESGTRVGSTVHFRVEITDATTVNISRGGTGCDMLVSFDVVEYENAKSMQKVNFTLTGTSTSGSPLISPVNLEKTKTAASHKSTSSQTGGSGDYSAYRMTNSETFNFSVQYAVSTTRTITAYIIEFK